MRWTFWLALPLALCGCSPQASSPPHRAAEREQFSEAAADDAQRPVAALLGLMRQRLLLQHEVARYKWHARLPITDAKREQELLDRAEAQARDVGLEPGFAREFFRAQIRAGKLVQQADFDAWQRGDVTPPADGPDLKALRLQIDGLNRKLLEALKEAGPGLRAEAGRRAVRTRADVVVQGRGITAEVRQAACAPLLGP
jgi:chorismate mutase